MALAIAGIIASVAGGALASGAASDAADAQVGATREANATQLKMFEEARADQMPWMTRGNQAGDLLATYLGLPGAGGANGVAPGMPPAPTIDQFTTRTGGGGYGAPQLNYLGTDGGGPHYAGVPTGMNLNYLAGGGASGNAAAGNTAVGGVAQMLAQRGQVTSTVDQQAYQAALADWTAKNNAALAALHNDPRYGSLLKPFGPGDLKNEPGYQFGLQQGSEALMNQQGALGGLLGGNTLRSLLKYGEDYAGTKYNEAFNRNQVTNNDIYNKLAGVSGTGQVTANQIGQQGINVGGQIGQNMIGAGNARASGYVGSANALTGSLQSGYGNYLSANLLKSLTPESHGTGPAYGDIGPGQTYNV